jgi:hypothetical protein
MGFIDRMNELAGALSGQTTTVAVYSEGEKNRKAAKKNAGMEAPHTGAVDGTPPPAPSPDDAYRAGFADGWKAAMAQSNASEGEAPHAER